MSGITQSRVRELLNYDPESGELCWRISRGNRIPAGKVIKCVGNHGYIVVRIDGVLHLAHRIIYLYMTGNFPERFLDHVNGNRTDNTWANLREASLFENSQNTKIRSDNRSGIKGVYRPRGKDFWIARINYKGQHHHLGVFSTKQDAGEAVRGARDALHRQFANHG